MKFIQKFNQISKNDSLIAGGKGASLGEMTQAGIPVPPGFVLLADAFERFLEKTDLNVEIDTILHTVRHDQIHTVENASEGIQALILKAEMPKDIADEVRRSFKKLGAKYVAVRSSATAEDSATAAWAGQLDTFLNTTEEDLIENVQKCWASLFTPRAIFYRFEKSLHKQIISVAVVVQKMVESETSGIAFSVHPVTEDRNQLIIEAALGLGEAIVSGHITPDSYVVEKQPRRIIDKNVITQEKGLFRARGGGNEWRDISKEQGEKQVLSDEQIFELSEIILRIEDYYGFPVDIEWAYACPERREGSRGKKGKFYIVQSRPITTLSDIPKEQTIEHSVQSKEEVTQTAVGKEDVYERQWGVEGYGQLFVDLLIHPHGYGEVDSVFLVEKGNHTEFYITPKGMKKAWAIGERMLEPTHAEKVFEDFKELNKKLLVYKLPDLNKENVVEKWDEYTSLWDETSAIYRYCDKPYMTPLEEVIQEQISSEAELLDLLSNSKGPTREKLNNKGKHALDTLMALGEAKLKTHENLETLFNEGPKHFFSYAEKTFGISPRDSSVLLKDEFKGMLAGERISQDLIKSRLAGSIFMKEHNKWVCLSGKDYEQWRDVINNSQPNEIKGQVAYRGKVIGKVTTHLSWMGITNLEEGTVLVTGMTNPQMVPYLKKVGAIVTDEGGLTCHAAIISRELKVPCIVGTKVATKLLKDGDLVEVDADRGTVKILDKAPKNSLPALLKSGNYTHIGSYSASPFGSYFWSAWYSQWLAKETDIKTDFGGWLNLSGRHIFYHTEAIQPITNFFRTKIENIDTAFFKDFSAHAEKEFLSAIRFADNLKINITTLAHDFQIIVARAQRIVSFWCLGWQLSQVVDEWLKNKPEQLDFKLNEITKHIPRRATPLACQQKEARLLKRLLEKENMWSDDVNRVEQLIISSPAFSQKFQKHLQTYSWILNVDWTGERFTLGKLLDQMKHIDLSAFAHKPKTSAFIKKYEHILLSASMNQSGSEYLSMFAYKVDDFLSMIASQALISREELKLLMPTEIFVGNNIALDLREKVERRKNDNWCTYTDSDNSVKTIDDMSLINTLNKIFLSKQQDQGKETLSGQIGYQGKVSGIAKIIISAKDFSKIQTGDVLISPMTTPDFVLVMQRAAAIVTDMGGMLSHAAIVSRELRKPCVIGTEIATQVLKDGDLVEVDANEGVVRILEKAKETNDIIAKIKNTKWIKNWDGKFSLFDGLFSSNRRVYFEKMQELFHVPFGNAIVLTRAGFTEGFIDEEQVRRFCRTLIGILEKDRSVAAVWMERLMKATDVLDGHFKKDPVKYVNAKTFEHFWDDIVTFTIYMSIGKEVVNHLPKRLQNELFPVFEKGRKYSEHIFFVIEPFLDGIFNEIARKESYTRDEVSALSGEETADWLSGGALPPRKILRKRYKSSAFFLGETTEEIQMSVEKLRALMFPTDFKNIHTLSGVPAYGGTAKGRCRLVTRFDPSTDFKKGEILVTGMTSPDYMSIIKLSAAIITDEGGLLSHSAIVSRELKKPCVVGTKIATQVLKDGDLVEVDADKGVVYILNRSNDYKPEDYSRMFSGKGFSFLLGDLFMSHYGESDVLSVFDGTTWTSFIPKRVVKKMCAEGKKLYESEKLYRKYKDDFVKYIKRSEKKSKTILRKGTLTLKDVNTIFGFVTEHFSIYKKTEFFYTDCINQKKMHPTVKEFDELKLRGREHLNKLIFEEKGFIQSLIRKLSKQINVPQKELLQMTSNEVREILEKRKLPKDFNLEDRTTGYFQSKDALYFGTEGRNKARVFIEKYQQAGDIIKGTTASPGYVKARAFVIAPDISNFELYKKQINKMKKGDVLLAETTSPEVIQACKKASAIVTNQGGMLSHAAIISRELKIPCIIGTDRDVLENIKTGDFIEVDANEGVVRVVERKKA